MDQAKCPQKDDLMSKYVHKTIARYVQTHIQVELETIMLKTTAALMSVLKLAVENIRDRG